MIKAAGLAALICEPVAANSNWLPDIAVSGDVAALSDADPSALRAYRESAGGTLMHVVAREGGNPEILGELARHGLSVDARDAGGQLPLRYALDRDALPMAAMLVALGANLDLETAPGLTIARWCEGLLAHGPHRSCSFVLRASTLF